jgi:hypothetical protein
MYAIDHVVLAVADLEEAGERLHHEHGLASMPGGVHPRWGTANRIVPLGQDYVELIAVVDPGVAEATVLGRALLGLTADGRDRWFAVCLSDTEIEATAARLGLTLEPGERMRPDGSRLRWRGAGIDDTGRERWLPFFIAWDAPVALHPGRGAIEHDAAALGIARVDVAGDAGRLRAWLGPAGDALPIEVVDGEPGVRAVVLATEGGDPIRL